jgi:hypothetical protein
MPNPIQYTNDPHWDGTTSLGKTATRIEITSDTSAASSAGKTATFDEDSAIERIVDKKE